MISAAGEEMKPSQRQSGLSLTEMLVVVTAVSVLATLSMPAIRTFFDSMATVGSTKAMISSALSTARAIAAKEQRYAGVRFQTSDPCDPLNAPQYMIFIIHEEPGNMGNMTMGFRAVEGAEPIKLSDNIVMTDLRVRTNHVPGSADLTGDELIFDTYNGTYRAAYQNCFADPVYLADMMSFSIVFSPGGKMVIHEVRTRNRDGDFKPANPDDSHDDIFNSPVNIDNGVGMFVQDDYSELGFGAENSRKQFYICDLEILKEITDMGGRYDYFYDLEDVYINPYTGRLVSSDK